MNYNSDPDVVWKEYFLYIVDVNQAPAFKGSCPGGPTVIRRIIANPDGSFEYTAHRIRLRLQRSAVNAEK